MQDDRQLAQSSKPWALTADIGGTRARFARCDLDGSHLVALSERRTADFPTIEAALHDATREAGGQPTLVSLAIAAPVSADAAQLTNAHWAFTADDVKAATGAERLQLINDFEALARVLPRLTSDDIATVKPGTIWTSAPCVVLGPGTGLGMAGYAPAPGGWTAFASEGGHATFGATSEAERKVHDHLASTHGHVSWERVISGSGLSAMVAAFGGATPREPADVVEAARRREEPALLAVICFVEARGRFASDAALMLGARGGVYIAGGIAPKILDFVDTDAFRTAFLDKGRMSSYLAPIPVNVIVAPDAGLRGAAAALTDLIVDADRAGWVHV